MLFLVFLAIFGDFNQILDSTNKVSSNDNIPSAQSFGELLEIFSIDNGSLGPTID